MNTEIAVTEQELADYPGVDYVPGCQAPGARGQAGASVYGVSRKERSERNNRCAANRCPYDFEFYCYHPSANARAAKQGDRLSRRRACRAHAERFAKAHGIEMPR